MEKNRQRDSTAKQVGASVVGIVGRGGCFTAKSANACVIMPTLNPDHDTPHSKAFQVVVCQIFLSHPKLNFIKTRRVSIK